MFLAAVEKVGGILAESKQIKGETYVVMGVGINVNEQEFPNELSETATSLRVEKESTIQREPLLAFILNAFESIYNNKKSEWIKAWNYHCGHLNSDVKFHHENETIQGTFLGIDSMGEATIKINGITKKFSSGIVEHS